jgi:hypothetical protein
MTETSMEFRQRLANKLRGARDYNMGAYGEWAYYKIKDIEAVISELNKSAEMFLREGVEG